MSEKGLCAAVFVLCATMLQSTQPTLRAATPVVDVSGRWNLKKDPDYRGNPGPWVECIFKQQNERLTVKCGTGGEMQGQVHGRTVTWGFAKTGIPPVLEDRLVATHTAELNESATALRGTWRLTSSVLNEKGTFQAKKEP
jgi:hypothetical protein